jgi:hypothetical protein
MKKSVVTLEHVHDESEFRYNSHKTSMPKLSYSVAMSSYFVIQGRVHQVEDAPFFVIEQFINAAMATTKNPKSCVEALAGLDYRESVSRFYALNELLRLRASVPLFTSREEAEKSLEATLGLSCSAS